MTAQPLLFDAPPLGPQGFAYAPGLIGPSAQADLLARIETLAFRPFEFRGHVGRRQVAYFGWKYDYAAGRADAADPIPDFLLPLRERAADFAGLDAARLEQV